METVVQSRQQQLAIVEDSSDRSESSSVSQEYQIRGFEDYDIVKRLKQSVVDRDTRVPRSDDSPSKSTLPGRQYQIGVSQFDEVNVNVGKSKDFGFAGDERIGDALNYQLDKSREAETATEVSNIGRTKEPTMREAFLNLSRDARHKYISASYERSPKDLNYLVEREIKEYGLAKGYNLPLDRMKEFNLPLDRIRDRHTTVLPRDRLSGGGLLDNARILDVAAHRNLQIQPRNPQDLETIEYERIRRQHLLNRMDFAAQNLAQLPHSRHSGVTQIQQPSQQQQQQQQHQQQQQQIKSFTIDAILAHRNNQRERHQRNQQQQMRKAARQECQEVTTKSGASCTGNAGSGSGGGNGGGGKAKRVRTIFTAEQLERLEGEFARQQYMVGPERLYLAHALRLTEAQVKVWFQNRRIKWRKVNHEQQCQAVNEHRQRCSLPSLELHEDGSDETTGKWSSSAIAATIAAGEDSRDHREPRPSPVAKP